jgi:hypothetical protein
VPQQDINLRSYGPAYTQLGQQIRSVLLQVGLPPEVQQRVASMNDEDLGRFASEFDPEFRGFADEFMRADAPPFSVIPQRPEPTTPTERYNRA